MRSSKNDHGGRAATTSSAATMLKATSETAIYSNFVSIQTKEDVFDKYEILQNFGSGSMGCVYKVRMKHDQIGGSAFHPTITKRKSLIASIRSSLPFSGSKKEEPPQRRPVAKQTDAESHVYALKSILLDRISSEFIEELQNEIMILRNMDHPNIVKAYGVYVCKPTMIYLVLELCDGGDLYTRSPYTEKNSAKIATKLLSAVWYVHV
jgi:serine/threonine protein kinase